LPFSARRNAVEKVKKETRASLSDEHVVIRKRETVLEEVCEIITLPESNPHVSVLEQDHLEIKIPRKVLSQIRSLVKSIASMYCGNSFHNFEHASHVGMCMCDRETIN
jgi:hypothetical protein